MNIESHAPPDRQAGKDEIEITPEMIEAGVSAYSLCDREWDLSEQIVREVFEAMISAAPQYGARRFASNP